jgi:SAM-dependent methyltransferase
VTDYKKFWIENKLKDIARSNELIQGDWDIAEYLYDMFDDLDCDNILDFGCGYGRLAPIFPSDVYVGVDLNPNAIKKAWINNPRYDFREVNIDSKYPCADLVLAFTVFLHMEDDTLLDVLKRLHKSCNKYLVIIETLGHEWRSSGTVPVYNREKDEYIDLLQQASFSPYKHESFRNPHYAEDIRFKGKNCNTDVLIFKKEQS